MSDGLSDYLKQRDVQGQGKINGWHDSHDVKWSDKFGGYVCNVCGAVTQAKLSARCVDPGVAAFIAGGPTDNTPHTVEPPSSPDDRVGRWLSAALDDPKVCDEMKADINAWFASKTPSNTDPFPGERSEYPVFTGALKYFPLAFAAIAKCSYLANEQHNPGEPMHWAKHKSIGDGNQLLRHLMQAGTRDAEGVPHSWKMLWRAAEFVQRECEAEIAAGRDPFAISK